jgi:hypothetical protein
MSLDDTRCIDGPDGCAGRVQQSWPGYGERTWPRCERHDRERLQRERAADAPGICAPHDFDPADAGERWELH